MGAVKRRCKLVFLLLILAQAAHSVEECETKLYDVLAPARFVASLFSRDIEPINGVNHLATAVWQRGYFPGALTALLLLSFAGWLVVLRTHGAVRPAVS